jgi:aspartate aminotransferase
MKNMVSDKVKNCQDSFIVMLLEKAEKYQKSGKYVIDFGIGEPIFSTPDYICSGVKKAMDSGDAKYDNLPVGYSLRNEISNKFREDKGLDYSTENIIVTSGAKAGISIALQTLLNQGDEVIIPKPYRAGYIEMVTLFGGTPVIAETSYENQFKLTPEDLIHTITSKTKAMIFNAPVNPTGALYTLDELLALSDVLVRNDIIVISDERYDAYRYDQRKYISIASLNSEIKNQAIVVNDFSKSFRLSGWQIGYLAGNTELITGIKRIQNYLGLNPSTISQYAGMTALKEKTTVGQEMIQALDEQRQVIIEKLDEMPEISYIYPESAVYIFVDISEILSGRRYHKHPDTSIGFSLKLLENAKVLVFPGEIFGMPQYIRLSFAKTVDKIETGFKRIKDFIKNY